MVGEVKGWKVSAMKYRAAFIRNMGYSTLSGDNLWLKLCLQILRCRFLLTANFRFVNVASQFKHGTSHGTSLGTKSIKMP